MRQKSSFLLLFLSLSAALSCRQEPKPVAIVIPPIVLVCGFDHSESVEGITHVDTHALKTLILNLLDLHRTVYVYVDVIGSPTQDRPLYLILNCLEPQKGPTNIFLHNERREDSLENRAQNLTRIEAFIRLVQARIQARAMSLESDILGFLDKASTIFNAPDLAQAHKTLLLQTDGEQATFAKGKHFICGENLPDVTIYGLDWSMEHQCPDIIRSNSIEDFTRTYINQLKQSYHG